MTFVRTLVETRSTRELLVLGLFGLVSVLELGAAAAVLLLALYRPDVDTSNLAGTVSELIPVLMGAVLGYIARGTDYEGSASPGPRTSPRPRDPGPWQDDPPRQGPGTG